MTMRTAIGMLAALAPLAAGASSPPALRLPEKELASEAYEYVNRTRELPDDVRRGLARQLGQDELEMADAGAPFSSTDVITEPALPGYRLILAAVGPRYSVVHFERGGIALVRRVVVFGKGAAGMSVLWDGAVSKAYPQAKDLEGAIRSGTLWRPAARP